MCKCSAHTNARDPVSRGNAQADAAAKAAAESKVPPTSCEMMATCSDPLASLPEMQSLATQQERSLWRSCGATCDTHDNVWIGPNGNPCLPKHFFPHFAKLTHGLDHVSKGGMLEMINQFWFTKGFSVTAQKYCESCLICVTQNSGKPIKMSAISAHPPPTRPFEHIMLDFIELLLSGVKKHCHVVVDVVKMG